MSQLSMPMPETVQSVVRCQENGPLVAAAAQLWIRPGDLVLDVTYGRGLFWTRYRPERLVAHDLITDGVDFRHLPEPDASVDVVVFDPPYIPQAGRETSTVPDFIDRYGLRHAPKTRQEMEQLWRDGLAETHRVLRAGGRLFVKCMDYINDHRFISGRHVMVATASELGLAQVDEFVHYSGAGPGAWERQFHSRRVHSFLCVFEKGNGVHRGAHIDGQDD